ncbi:MULTISPECIES: hypothetical protein [unclassified Aeromicrobium]|uniref:hypothetical protein n=1 Tax=unclassified Aeromicrobium TaxID=2633570 RepID=UPI002097DF38|nr:MULTISPECIES: hypothetical protein [unclassified Aeromicrobium]MCO7237745.1 hypothetical protein [Aeromicrobium sp. CnD17-E]MDR6117705.1 hypothetical protein [Aeromicrobium sp. SORGH_AS_0981]
MKKAVSKAAPVEFQHLTVEQVWALLGWSERCASVALGSGDTEWLVAGTRAVLLVEDAVERRDRAVVLELLAYTATRLGKFRDVARRLSGTPALSGASFESRDTPPPTHVARGTGRRRVLARVDEWDPLVELKDFLD